MATAVASVVLYLDDQRPRDIAIIAVAILALLATIVLVAPRLGVPARQDAVPRARNDDPTTADDTAPDPRRPPEQASGTGPPAARATTTGSQAVSPEAGGDIPTGPAKSGRRAKRGRRRR